MNLNIDLPDELVSRCAAQAASTGVPMDKLVQELLERELSKPASLLPTKLPLVGFGEFGQTAEIKEDTLRIQEYIDEEFGKIDSNDWK